MAENRLYFGDNCPTFTLPINGQTYPRLQVITVAQLLRGERPKMPPTMLPYIPAARAAAAPPEQETLDF